VPFEEQNSGKFVMIDIRQLEKKGEGRGIRLGGIWGKG